jgi:hypothetical protein
MTHQRVTHFLFWQSSNYTGKRLIDHFSLLLFFAWREIWVGEKSKVVIQKSHIHQHNVSLTGDDNASTSFGVGAYLKKTHLSA